ncbi:MAG: hypothetical protein MUC45_00340 [Actinomycetia bacterium]|jgi:hypothetical protein|nr:hypothetical protein [Actinomycetes bacterium]
MSEQAGVRVRLEVLLAALAQHLAAVESRAGEADPAVFAAFDHLADAFAAYEEALYDVHDEVVPMTLVAYDEEDDEEL